MGKIRPGTAVYYNEQRLLPHVQQDNGCLSFIRRKISISTLRLQLHGAIYRPDSFVMMLRYCANLKAIRYESTNLNRIVAGKSHRVIVA